MSQRWVFDALVKDREDKIGLIAYSLYKFEKNELANRLNSEGKTPTQIRSELRTFHDHALGDSRIEGFRNHAEVIIRDLMDQIEEDLRAEYQLQFDNVNTLLDDYDSLQATIKDFPNVIKRERENAILEFHRAVTRKESRETGRIIRAIKWVRDGFQGVIAAILLALFIYGLCALALSPDDRQGIVDKAYNNFKASFFQQANTPIVNSLDGQ
ncbi:TPA: hypothetical protein MB376_005064 [Klebsiella pneumoniae]|uniref:hypothetical protein n=1 Tax=Klebsiella pneumoniae TaxID=573 RepID=UPI002040687F|nr:hypothetical protein [Klebsiella pneumoniae]HBM2903936.1 hypothetical protein [Klebsiella oxytoca]USB73037.1 hypothetical protein KU667_25925 [Klebsiella pneumoniae]HBM3284612.1 hypothetical protein [Klebsiella oxytoca]HBT4599353.1 hypothetical protein [Klebsiella pneumoniae]HBT4856633.1 hypothetical protein [Klebsiella pneumoniae]